MSPTCGCVMYLMRYATGSHMHGFGLCMSIFMRNVASPSPNFPFRMSSNRRRFSSTLRLRHGDSGFKSDC